MTIKGHDYTVMVGKDEKGYTLLTVGIGEDIANTVECGGGTYQVVLMKRGKRYIINGKKSEQTTIHKMMLDEYQETNLQEQMGKAFLPPKGFRF